VDVRALLASVALLARAAAAAAGVRIVLERDDTPLPPVRGDVDQLRQALLNLAVNAIEALSAAAGAERVVRLGARHEDASVVLWVIDTGPGLAEDLLPTAFEPFRSGKPQGMGLGLMICRTIVEKHGGRIVASNQPGRGAAFEITLPVETGHE
jgi:signal transduction histidine kinase